MLDHGAIFIPAGADEMFLSESIVYSSFQPISKSNIKSACCTIKKINNKE
jgi:hypothetical protein